MCELWWIRSFIFFGFSGQNKPIFSGVGVGNWFLDRLLLSLYSWCKYGYQFVKTILQLSTTLEFILLSFFFIWLYSICPVYTVKVSLILYHFLSNFLGEKKSINQSNFFYIFLSNVICRNLYVCVWMNRSSVIGSLLSNKQKKSTKKNFPGCFFPWSNGCFFCLIFIFFIIIVKPG